MQKQCPFFLLLTMCCTLGFCTLESVSHTTWASEFQPTISIGSGRNYLLYPARANAPDPVIKITKADFLTTAFDFNRDNSNIFLRSNLFSTNGKLKSMTLEAQIGNLDGSQGLQNRPAIKNLIIAQHEDDPAFEEGFTFNRRQYPRDPDRNRSGNTGQHNLTQTPHHWKARTSVPPSVSGEPINGTPFFGWLGAMTLDVKDLNSGSWKLNLTGTSFEFSDIKSHSLSTGAWLDHPSPTTITPQISSDRITIAEHSLLHNPHAGKSQFDVNNDGYVSSLDALLIADKINELGNNYLVPLNSMFIHPPVKITPNIWNISPTDQLTTTSLGSFKPPWHPEIHYVDVNNDFRVNEQDLIDLLQFFKQEDPHSASLISGSFETFLQQGSIDKGTINAVPEPTTWGLGIFTLLALGGMLYLQKRLSVKTAKIACRG